MLKKLLAYEEEFLPVLTELEKKYKDPIIAKFSSDLSMKRKIQWLFSACDRFIAFHKDEIKRIKKVIDDETCSGVGTLLLDLYGFLKQYLLYAQNYERYVMFIIGLTKNPVLGPIFKREKSRYTLGDIEFRFLRPIRHADGYKSLFMTDFHLRGNHPDALIINQVRDNLLEFANILLPLYTDASRLYSLVLCSDQFVDSVCFHHYHNDDYSFHSFFLYKGHC